MQYNLSKKYEWPGMYTQIRNFVSRCQTCLQAGRAVANTNFHMLTASTPGELIEIDTVGPLPCTPRGNKFIITAIDHFTKIAWARAVTHKSADCVLRFLTEDVLTIFPDAKNILSDNGLEFKSATTLKVMNEKGIHWKFGSPYHPETQGVIERFNDTIMRKLKKVCNFSHDTWDTAVHLAIDAYNKSFHRAVGCSPFELLHKETPLFSVDAGLVSKKHLKNFRTYTRNQEE
ncbi:putative Integrase, catalytic core, Ribonuclease H-like, LTR Retrotransposon protein [Trachipleistophora hominis]|uniref:Putative Integrase, catalytic core, Ribonuclease H-like, LTR Retrotransposon protein n=1 Tax=Trachipleistophora hominis TaxID=72359 RepID=L7JX47_TRAHO|nr:putative Integrase, catalytic core, Ribonuclease H-like, LTR Retrotransposon protein [Trachipleistophora hominis]